MRSSRFERPTTSRHRQAEGNTWKNMFLRAGPKPLRTAPEQEEEQDYRSWDKSPSSTGDEEEGKREKKTRNEAGSTLPSTSRASGGKDKVKEESRDKWVNNDEGEMQYFREDFVMMDDIKEEEIDYDYPDGGRMGVDEERLAGVAHYAQADMFFVPDESRRYGTRRSGLDAEIMPYDDEEVADESTFIEPSDPGRMRLRSSRNFGHESQPSLRMMKPVVAETTKQVDTSKGEREKRKGRNYPWKEEKKELVVVAKRKVVAPKGEGENRKTMYYSSSSDGEQEEKKKVVTPKGEEEKRKRMCYSSSSDDEEEDKKKVKKITKRKKKKKEVEMTVSRNDFDSMEEELNWARLLREGSPSIEPTPLKKGGKKKRRSNSSSSESSSEDDYDCKVYCSSRIFSPSESESSSRGGIDNTCASEEEEGGKRENKEKDDAEGTLPSTTRASGSRGGEEEEASDNEQWPIMLTMMRKDRRKD